MALDKTFLCAYMHPMPMARRSIVLTVKQHVFLEKEAARLEISVSDLIRRIIDEHIAKHWARSVPAARALFDIQKDTEIIRRRYWKNRGNSGVQGEGRSLTSIAALAREYGVGIGKMRRIVLKDCPYQGLGGGWICPPDLVRLQKEK
jgi:hypothetical protein